MPEFIPHPANVPGDFYVVDGCCILCEVPFGEAPELFGKVHDPRGYQHCHVKRQPETPPELDQMINAIRFGELQCIRYCGSDRRIQLRLISEGEGIICDGLPADLQAEAERQEAAQQRQFQEWKQQASTPPRSWWRFW